MSMVAKFEIDTRQDSVTITLSRRNLLALYHKLSDPGSERTIGCGDIRTDGKQTSLLDHPRIYIRCEDDLEHYKGRLPGYMSHTTEQFIQEGGEDLMLVEGLVEESSDDHE